MKTHGDLVSSGSFLVRSEMLLTVSEYVKKMKACFADSQQLQVSWDASTYDIETLVCVAYDPAKDVACYLPHQNISPANLSELDHEHRKLALQNKVTRVDSFNSLRALSNALNGINRPLASFLKDDSLQLGPLLATQERVAMGGHFFLYDKKSQTASRQLPLGMDITQHPVLISISDQGPLNTPGLDLLQYNLGAYIVVFYDQYHRSWNDVKSALRTGLQKCPNPPSVRPGAGVL